MTYHMTFHSLPIYAWPIPPFQSLSFYEGLGLYVVGDFLTLNRYNLGMSSKSLVME